MQQPLLKLLGQEAAQLGYIAYVVGGFVRDSVLSRSQASFLDIDIVLDIDIAQNAAVDQLDSDSSSDLPSSGLRGIVFAHHLQKKYGGHIITHSTFGTAKWIMNDPSAPLRHLPLDPPVRDSLPAEIDLVTARNEQYPEPAALPIITPSDLADDLRRRDITINMLAVCLAPNRWQQLCDQHNSLHDIKAGLVRVLHDQSFIDDPTRIFRAIRYECRYQFTIEPHTFNLLQQALPQIAKLSPVRIRHELDRTLSEDTIPELTLQRMDQLGVLTAIHQQLWLPPQTGQTFSALRTTLTQPSTGVQEAARKILAVEAINQLYWVQLLALLHPPKISSAIGKRLGLPKETIHAAHDLYVLMQISTWPTSAHKSSIQQGIAAPNCGVLLPSQIVASISQFDSLAIALFATDEQSPQQHRLYAAQYLAEWRHSKPLLNGNDLRALGIAPGPQYRLLLNALHNLRLDGILTDRESEVAYIQGQIAAL